MPTFIYIGPVHAQLDPSRPLGMPKSHPPDRPFLISKVLGDATLLSRPGPRLMEKEKIESRPAFPLVLLDHSAWLEKGGRVASYVNKSSSPRQTSSGEEDAGTFVVVLSFFLIPFWVGDDVTNENGNPIKLFSLSLSLSSTSQKSRRSWSGRLPGT